MNLNYEIMPVKDMFIDITELDDQFVRQDTNTMASIYRGTSGSYYIIPAVGPLGIKSSKEIIDSIIESGFIPIQNSENLFLTEKDRVLDISKNLPHYLKLINQDFNISLSFEQDFVALDLKEINNKIKSMDPQLAYQKYFIPLGMVIGEFIRSKTGGIWCLDKRYAYNPYFVPYIKSENGNHLPWYKLSEMLLKKKFDIKKYFDSVDQARNFL